MLIGKVVVLTVADALNLLGLPLVKTVADRVQRGQSPTLPLGEAARAPVVVSLVPVVGPVNVSQNAKESGRLGVTG